ncbi:LysR family transcriptional regulator [Solibacillus merdavium]|uniref:LysR family transcriptional regulator n=1 Tax=Solibacillus merdavium TaxID=2762218 RepID=A0ABR8XKL3_9BACL|nr:LysR family transcriptional regulator [Solibacillus merdavium]MBD8032460.1 LysR family transcriptional regulator [Solibacillus merdavium]
MELKWLKTFVTVYECGNFRVAAEKLFISQPSISVHIKLLEEDLKVPLFVRNHTQIQLTREGDYFYPLAKEILEKVNENKKLLLTYSNSEKIQLSIALSPILVTTKLPEILYEFMSHFTNYELDIVIEESHDIDVLIRLQTVHLAIGTSNSKFKDIHAEKLQTSPLVLAYSPSFKDEDKKISIILSELLKGYPMFVGYLEGIEPLLTLIEQEHKIARKNTIKESNIVKQLVLGGLGIGFLPKFLIEEELAEGRLKILELKPHMHLFPVEIYMKHVRESEQLLPLLNFIRKKYNSNF